MRRPPSQAWPSQTDNKSNGTQVTPKKKTRRRTRQPMASSHRRDPLRAWNNGPPWTSEKSSTNPGISSFMAFTMWNHRWIPAVITRTYRSCHSLRLDSCGWGRVDRARPVRYKARGRGSKHGTFLKETCQMRKTGRYLGFIFLSMVLICAASSAALAQEEAHHIIRGFAGYLTATGDETLYLSKIEFVNAAGFGLGY